MSRDAKTAVWERTAFIVGLLGLAGITGCSTLRPVDMADANVGTFRIHYPRSLAPFYVGRVESIRFFSVTAVETKKTLWQIENVSRIASRDMYFTYGIVPKGFLQSFPPGGARPEPLRKGQKYYLFAPTAYRRASVFAFGECFVPPRDIYPYLICKDKDEHQAASD